VSHHLDSELSREDNGLDLTDHYVFRGETGTVFVMDVNSSLATDAPLGWHPEARYESVFGFAAMNGRDLADNAPEVMVSPVMNAAVSTGLTPGQFADTRSATFPYVVAAQAE
jgi:hypothetical protein